MRDDLKALRASRQESTFERERQQNAEPKSVPEVFSPSMNGLKFCFAKYGKD
jgi:hypothetical protein